MSSGFVLRDQILSARSDQPLPQSCLAASSLVANLFHSLLGLEYHGICFVSCIDCFLPLLILCFVLSSFFDCLVDLGIRHVGTGSDRDVLLFACTQILSGYVYDTVGIDIESNLDLRNTSSCWRDTIQTELAKRLVVSRELSLTLYNMDIYCSLVICCSGEDLALLCRDRGISLDQPCCYAAQGLDRQRQRGNIQKKDIACTCISCEFTTLNRSTEWLHTHPGSELLFGSCPVSCLTLSCTAGIRVEPPTRSTLDRSAGSKACIFQCVLYRDNRSLYQIMCQLIKFCSGQIHLKMLRTSLRLL